MGSPFGIQENVGESTRHIIWHRVKKCSVNVNQSLSLSLYSIKQNTQNLEAQLRCHYQGHNLMVTTYNRLDVLVTPVVAGISYGPFYTKNRFQGAEEVPNCYIMGVRE